MFPEAQPWQRLDQDGFDLTESEVQSASWLFGSGGCTADTLQSMQS